jgi:hypothetical protein
VWPRDPAAHLQTVRRRGQDRHVAMQADVEITLLCSKVGTQPIERRFGIERISRVDDQIGHSSPPRRQWQEGRRVPDPGNMMKRNPLPR